MLFEYNSQHVFVGQLDVVDPGNMCLKCSNDQGSVYFILTKSCFGKLHILKIGPILEDADVLLDGFNVSYKKSDYKDALIAKEVGSYINDPRKRIIEVEELMPEEVYDILPDVAVLFRDAE